MMKKIIFIGLFTMILFGCGNSNKQQSAVSDTPVVAISVDDLYKNATNLEDKEVVVKGTVTHVCKEGGARCFLMGSSEDVLIRVEAGEKIGSFNQEQIGNELEIVGIFKMVKTEADAHNPGHMQGEGEEANNEDAQAEHAHKMMAASQEASEVVYFIEGLKVKEL
ncbi:MAG: hypothetical protein R2757_00545 [Draconibacterium sp.]|jgi:hypothetical protein